MKQSKASRRFVIVGDNHGSEQDDESVNALFRFCEDWQPEIVVHLGDNWDFRPLRKKADKNEQRQSLSVDFEVGQQFFNRLFSFGIQRYFLRGNHDERLWTSREDGGVIGDYCAEAVLGIEQMCRRASVKMLPYDSRDGVLKIGHLQILHGYHHGVSACATHARIYSNCVFGHIHSIESYQVPGLETKEARSIGCLCKLDMPYMSTKTAKLRWANGWAYGISYPDGTYTILQTRKIEGNFHAAPELKPY